VTRDRLSCRQAVTQAMTPEAGRWPTEAGVVPITARGAAPSQCG